MKNKKRNLLILGIALLTVAFVNYKVSANAPKPHLTVNKNHLENSSIEMKHHLHVFAYRFGHYECIYCGFKLFSSN